MIQDTGYKMQNRGYMIQDTGYKMQNKGYMIQDKDTGYRIRIQDT